MRVLPDFVSVGVNRVVNALDWGENGLIAYCGHRIVCIYDPEAAEVVGTLTGHTGQANCVKWLPSSVTSGGSAVLLSGAADNTIRVWAWHGQQHTPPWTCITELKVHESPVTSLALQVLSNQQLLLASTSADPCIRLWQCDLNTSSSSLSQQQQCDPQQQQQQQQQCDPQQQLQLLQERFGSTAWQQQPDVHVGTVIQHCVALAALPGNPDCVLMASGGTDSTIQLFVRNTSTSTSSSSSHAAAPGSVQQTGAAASPCMPTFQLQCQLKGHENWVKGAAFTAVREPPGKSGQQGEVSLLLATAGQDRYARIWCISTDPGRTDASTSSTAGAGGAGDDALRKLITRYAPRPHLLAAGHTYWVTLEALLIGHEDWLHSVSWRPVAADTATVSGTAAAPAGSAATGMNGSSGHSSTPSRSDLTLLTTSQDRSMMLWGYDTPNELWLSDAAVGDAGASCLGFYGGAFNPSGDQLVAHGFTGALHLWRQQVAAVAAMSGGCGSSGSNERRLWVPQHALGGHYGAVQDLAWGADGACLQTVATDQTARLFTGIEGHWFELARTQVHGHDFSCLATIPTPTSSSSSTDDSSTQAALPPACVMYVSGSEEKVLRVFEAPQTFTESLTAVRSLQSPAAAAATAAALEAASAANSSSSSGGNAAASAGRGRALGASVAALGLSNKAVFLDEGDESGLGNNESGADGSQLAMGAEAYNAGPDFVPCATPAVVSGPPLEEHLAQNTLWPEVRKLYGHGNDVFCVCSSPSGSIIASACKAQCTGAAAVWVWEVGSWRSLAQLSGHTLTVTQLEFSPDGAYLLSASRDRSFSVWTVPQQYRRKVGAAAAAAGAGAAATGTAAAAAAAAGAVAAGAVDGSSGAGAGFDLLGRLKAAHSRIIWGVSWAHDGSFFATGSRDQTVKLWALAAVGQQQQKPLAVLPPFPACITAVALSPQHVSAALSAQGASSTVQQHLLAVGMEDGQVQVWSLQQQQQQQQRGQEAEDMAQQAPEQAPLMVCEQVWCSAVWQQHAAAVRRLRWAPACVSWLCEGSGASAVALASCGEDHSVRVFRVELY